MIPDQYRDKIAKIKELYNTAEADLKNVGREMLCFSSEAGASSRRTRRYPLR